MLLRSPQICNCSVAAARKVSPAANMTFFPSPCKRFANLPIVVVLPTPFTPTTKITNGFLFGSICKGLTRGASKATNSSCKALYSECE